MIAVLVPAVILIFIVAYRLYGRFLSRQFELNDARPTPAVTRNDGLDYVPAKAGFLLGQHFSAIAAAGPIVGPIAAGMAYGWAPALLWIVLGAIFIGGVHDFTSLVASIRHQGASMGEIVKANMSRTAYGLFLAFVWVCLVYVIIAFTDVTAQTFKTVSGGEAYGPAVAGSSMLYLVAGVAMGLILKRWPNRLALVTAVFVPLVLLIVWLGPNLPQPILDAFSSVGVKSWDVMLLAYCLVASLIPMWLLLQPRGYLGGWLLYLVVAVGLIGALSGRFTINYPALIAPQGDDGWSVGALFGGAIPLLPMLFITVACGACSGFHGIVSSGTTSKQLAKETDARRVGYGAMLLEGLVAVLALATVIMLAPADVGAAKADGPNVTYAKGIATYLEMFGLPFGVGLGFALLAFSTFVYDTLDVCTRLARYVFQEFTGLRGFTGGLIATAATLMAPLAFLLSVEENAWKVAWNLFGASNQLLASLTLMAVAVWWTGLGKKAWFVLAPMAFMMVMALWSLVVQTMPFWQGLGSLAQGGDGPTRNQSIVGVVGTLLLVLSVWLVVEAALVVARRRAKARAAAAAAR
jgi:carbon starvation protein